MQCHPQADVIFGFQYEDLPCIGNAQRLRHLVLIFSVVRQSRSISSSVPFASRNPNVMKRYHSLYLGRNVAACGGARSSAVRLPFALPSSLGRWSGWRRVYVWAFAATYPHLSAWQSEVMPSACIYSNGPNQKVKGKEVRYYRVRPGGPRSGSHKINYYRPLSP